MKNTFFPFSAVALTAAVMALVASCASKRGIDQVSEFDERARELLAQLTLGEKVSLMLNRSAPVERLGILPYEWWNEALHGVARAGQATVFPQAIGLAATFDDQAVYEMFDMVSNEARAKHHQAKRNNEFNRYQGLTFWTPNINIFRDPRWGRGMETYGEDPYLTSRMGVACVRGLQGDPNATYNKAHACAKHYAVHSGPEWNRHNFDAKNISQRDLWETYLPAFKELVLTAGVKEVMCAYNRFEGEPCCASNRLLIDILRNQWGFDGVILSDCWAIDNFFMPGRHETHPDVQHAVADAVITGVDLECGDAYGALIAAHRAGLITEEQIDVSVFRLLRARLELGNLDDDASVSWAKIPMSVVESRKHVEKALEMARKSMVLLNNKNNTLPLSKTLKRVAVLGPNANDSLMQWANYHGTPTRTITILEGIRSKLPADAVVYEKACDWVNDRVVDVGLGYEKEVDYDRDAGQVRIGVAGLGYEKEVDYDGMAATVADADVIIFVGGISPALEGEEMPVDWPGFRGGGRTHIDLPQVQVKMLEALSKVGKPVVFVLCSGSTMALTQEAAFTNAMLAAWYPGQQGGAAVADVLFGDYNPAGRLPLTFYASSDDLPDFEDYDMSKGRTYRYFKGKPLFPFGHGLSYTTFEYGKAGLSKNSIRSNESITLNLSLKNTGQRDGDEVVQVYVRNLQDPDGPVKSLRAFKRVTIKAGATQSIKLNLPPTAFEFFDPQTNRMTVKPGTYELLYGGSSDDDTLKALTLTIKST